MTQTWRPSTSPWPVTTPSAGALSEPSRFWARSPSSTNVPASKSRSMRSRAVSLPRSCCLAIFSSPPIARFFLRLAWSSPIRAAYSSVTVRILFADQQVLAAAPPIEEAVHVAFGKAIALARIGRLPQAVLVLLDGQTPHHHGASAPVAQAEAELHVGDAVEAEPRVEAADSERVVAAKGHGVALDRVD